MATLAGSFQEVPCRTITTRDTGELHHFKLAKYRFTLTAQSEIILPLYKGAVFHGGFGHALKKIAPSFYTNFYIPGKNPAPPKPFVLTPALENRQQYQPGDTLQFELVLIGNAIQHFPICFAAFEALGQQLGFGAQRGKFKIEKVERITAEGAAQSVYKNNTWRTVPAAVSGKDIAANHAQHPRQKLNVHFQTNLRLKDNNKLLPHTPPFTLLLNRLLGRLHTLSTFYHQTELINRTQRQSLLKQAEHIDIAHADTRWVEWPRYSGRQKEWMTFGGLQGSVTYQGDLTPFMPYLAIGEWVHVGGKTSFGLGKYQLNVE